MSQLDSQNMLNQLHDIIAPSAPSPWPLASIYWVLLVLIITAIIGLFFFISKYKKQQQKQKIALQKLHQLQQSKTSFIQLNQLLKGAALLYYPRQQVASLHGEKWFDFLQKNTDISLFGDKKSFMQRLYKNSEKNCSEDDFSQARIWIKSLKNKSKIQSKST
ncbi:MAG: DUF4381 domain-containing protein [Psychromonas sp.]